MGRRSTTTSFHARVHVGRSPRHGRGIFANADLPAGAVVEIAPVLLLTRAEGDAHGLVGRYVFEWDVDTDRTAYALALGLGSLFNHSGSPSCAYTRADDDEAVGTGVAPAMIFTTTRPVAAGEELTIDYSGVGDDDFPFGV